MIMCLMSDDFEIQRFQHPCDDGIRGHGTQPGICWFSTSLWRNVCKSVSNAMKVNFRTLRIDLIL